ncbi:MAG: preprotein translocase subunit YajC [Limnochordia bacterium]|jgi:preprotein translocase subunit YajC|nr:preprotein translocase subunit YajC [Limnochordia bacterium]MDI9465101.1 preprotein translocase subunit YajC [Bacillota bacterium]NLO95389.1 preprotein translocase subunit YajC [Bacillota bacterium]HAN95231.1 preprotein translocase subunit YajC [Bacillota bacterium]HOB40094.1 preprotein translocase subunit YajC [Limnochordia bacterium]
MFLQTDVPPAQGGLVGLLLPLVLLGVMFYFMIWRPQQKQQKERKAMLDSLKKGDKVVTIGGIHGELTALKEDYVTLKVADKVEIKLSRSGISHVLK